MFGHPKATNPYADKHESLADSYADGWDHGHGIACHNVPTLGETYFTESMGRVTADAENIREIHQDFCFQAEQNSRDFSPFEFTAHAFNSAGDGDDNTPSSDELWVAFEEGTSDAINADLSTYTDSDYGIEEEG